MQEALDSIRIDVNVTAVQACADRIWMQGDLEIQINGEKPYGDGDIINVDVFLKSLESDGEFFIFSCCCGVPSCSGWHKGIQVKHNEKSMTWIDENSNKKWRLDKSLIEGDMKRMREEVMNYKKFFAENQIEYVGVGYTW